MPSNFIKRMTKKLRDIVDRHEAVKFREEFPLEVAMDELFEAKEESGAVDTAIALLNDLGQVIIVADSYAQACRFVETTPASRFFHDEDFADLFSGEIPEA
jgi:hypothetical protein